MFDAGGHFLSPAQPTADTVLGVLGGDADVDCEMILSEMGIWRSFIPGTVRVVPDNPG